MQLWKSALAAGAVLVAAPIAFMAAEQFAPAADHLDPPARTDPAMDSTPDRAADIADIYAWSSDGTVKIVMTFAGPNAPGEPGTYDRDVLYTINISNDGKRVRPNIPIYVRFGEDTSKPGSQYGVQVSGLPGVTGGKIEGPVGTNLPKNGVRVRAGVFDDPFFFDLDGFHTTQMTGTLSFNKNRDFFSKLNDTAVIIEIPADRLTSNGNKLDIWATTGRYGGQL